MNHSIRHPLRGLFDRALCLLSRTPGARIAVGVLCLWLNGVALAAIQDSPLDTQILPVGQMFSLIIKADGESNPPARITADGLPPESVFLRNLDGSRTFIWIPDEGDLGDSYFLVTITDGSDSSISATYPINLEVVDMGGGESDENELAADSAEEPAENSAANTAATTADKPEVPPEPMAQAEIVDSQPTTETRTLTEPEIVPEAEAQAEPEPQPTPEPEIKTASAPLAEPVAAATPETDAESPPVYPTVNLSENNLRVSVDDEVSVNIRHSSENGNATELRAMNLPEGATLRASPDGHILNWTPEYNHLGSTAIILIVNDSIDPSLTTTRRLGLEVIE